MIVLNIVKAFVIRTALALHVILGIWRVTVMYDDEMFWLMSIALLPLVIEGFLTMIKRKGEEFKWFTPCFFFYLVAIVPCVWLLELDKSERYIDGTVDELEKEENGTDIGLPVNISLNPAMWNIIIEEMMLYLLIVSRWVLPRGKVTREQLSELMFAFIGIASDIMEMFSLFGESVVRENMYMGYWILTVWSVSVLQFTMTVTVTHQPKKAKNIKVIENLDEIHERIKIRNERSKDGSGMKIFAIVLSMMMQDVPFVTLRLYTIITFDLVTYSLIFFTSKNILVILLLIYKIAVILQKRFCPEPDDDEEEEGEIVDGVSSKGSLAYSAKGSKDDLQLITSGSQPSLQGNGKYTIGNGKSKKEPKVHDGLGDGAELKKRKGVGKSNKQKQKEKQNKKKSASKQAHDIDRNTEIKPTNTNPAAAPYLVNDPIPRDLDKTVTPNNSQDSLKDGRSIASSPSETGSGGKQPETQFLPLTNSDTNSETNHNAPSSAGSESPSMASFKQPQLSEKSGESGSPEASERIETPRKNGTSNFSDITPESSSPAAVTPPRSSSSPLSEQSPESSKQPVKPKPGDADFEPYVTVVKIP